MALEVVGRLGYWHVRIDRALTNVRILQAYGIADGTIQKALVILKVEGLVPCGPDVGVCVNSDRDSS